MAYIQGIDRNEKMAARTLENSIEPESLVRLIDAFTHAINLEKLGFCKTKPAVEGRPGYDPRDLLGLYLYGNLNKVRSSRCLARECRLNLEARWLMKELEPDFRTIADFRKDNPEALRNTFLEFSKILRGKGTPEFYSIDGSKFRACNAKDRNFTRSKLDDRIDRLGIQIEEYFRLLKETDEEETEREKIVSQEMEMEETTRMLSRKELEEKIKTCSERKERYEGYLEKMEREGLCQISLNDPDSRLMKSKNGYQVSHNVQTVIESDTYIIADFLVTSEAADYGMIQPVMKELKKSKSEEVILEVTVDKGYQSKEDMAACLEAGMIPSVILPEGKDFYELEFSYEEAELTEEEKKSTNASNIKECLQAGIIPEVYQDILEEIRIEEEQEIILEFLEETQEERTERELRESAAKGYFVRAIGKDKVYCPAGKILRRKSIKKMVQFVIAIN